MDLLSRIVNSYAPRSRKLPKSVLVCTHAKFSAVELCRSLVELGIKVTFYPVDYSQNEQCVSDIEQLGVDVLHDIKSLCMVLNSVDCAIEDGARVSKLIAEHDVATKKAFYAVEQTSGGIRYLIEKPPAYPVINVAMSQVKLDMENKRATPEGVLRHYLQATGTLLYGKRVLVVGFGNIGEGIALLARTYGAHVTVCEIAATKRMFAKHQGYSVVSISQLDACLANQEVIFMATNTYQGTLLSVERLLLMRDGATICNAGSGRGELSPELQQPGTTKAHDADVLVRDENGHLTISLHKADLRKRITVLAKAYPINLNIGEGTSHDAIEIVVSLLLLAMLEGPIGRKPGLQPLSQDIQERVAELVLRHETGQNSFAPVFVQTKQLQSIAKPYGGIFPFHNELNDIANLSVARVWFNAGSKTRGHYHRRTQEAYYIEQGTAEIILWPYDNPEQMKAYRVAAGDYLLVPENYFHDVRVTSAEELVALVIATPPFMIWDQFFKEEEHV